MKDQTIAIHGGCRHRVTPEAIRLSVGIEDIEDILEDLDQALTK